MTRVTSPWQMTTLLWKAGTGSTRWIEALADPLGDEICQAAGGRYSWAAGVVVRNAVPRSPRHLAELGRVVQHRAAYPSPSSARGRRSAFAPSLRLRLRSVSRMCADAPDHHARGYDGLA